MRYMTWNGLRLFTKPETAAAYAIKHDMDPDKIEILEHGKSQTPARWEIDELKMHIRDQTCQIT